ncbi:hypothetical protein QTN47_19975 [Danxiaibacter flavus]|uniref:Uncharacterized protein n=1 Tax=Danxiaibacter flavus TaxID=3049108 RepID=A0ABV3ZJP1_9BACT|nr:hypothetical protein QNM32_19985 [Chitinophagaceae bacterium DXS]
MSDVTSFSFEFEGKEYFAILRRRETGDGARLHVRIMNHKLDSLLGKECDNTFSEGERTPFPNTTGKSEQRLSAVIFEHIKGFR